MQQFRIKKTFKEIQHTHHQEFGGYPTYWSLFTQAWILSSQLDSPSIVYARLTLIVQSPWLLFIKPLGCLFSYKTSYVGSFQQINKIYENGQPDSDPQVNSPNVSKWVTFYFIKIPILTFPSNINDKDWERILN